MIHLADGMLIAVPAFLFGVDLHEAVLGGAIGAALFAMWRPRP